MTAPEAAETFINGNRKDCRDWVLWGGDGESIYHSCGCPAVYARDSNARTAAVALELIPGPLAEPGKGRDDFLRYMKGDS